MTEQRFFGTPTDKGRMYWQERYEYHRSQGKEPAWAERQAAMEVLVAGGSSYDRSPED